MIQTNQLSKSYGSIQALDKVSLAVKRSEICGLLGPNGSGKTTLFKILCNLITPDSGSFLIESNKVKSIGAIIEKPAIYEYLSAYENLWILSKIQGAPRDTKTLHAALDRVGLPIARKDPTRHFSLGMKQRLGIAIALLNDPDCLILDEPFLGLDPLGMKSLRELIKQLAHEKNLAILISSHLLEELTRICDTLNVIQNGRIIKAGLTQEILNNSTESYKICGNQLAKSEILKDLVVNSDGNCITLPLQVSKAPAMLEALVAEGNEITYFGPENNLTELYESK